MGRRKSISTGSNVGSDRYMAEKKMIYCRSGYYGRADRLNINWAKATKKASSAFLDALNRVVRVF